MEASAKDLGTDRRWATGTASRSPRPSAQPWEQVRRPPRLRPGEVHVFRSPLDLEPSELDGIRTILSPSELRRIDTLAEVDAGRATAGRGMLRALLAAYLDVEPRDVPLARGDGGKPTLGGVGPAADFHFNHARSGRIGIWAITGAGPVGVDVERVRPVDDLEADVFSSIERDTLRRLPPGLRAEGFHQCWTRKEALLKASGGELPCASLRDVDVSLTPGVPARVYRWRKTTATPGDWTLLHLRPAAGFVGAVAVRGRPQTLRTWSWDGFDL